MYIKRLKISDLGYGKNLEIPLWLFWIRCCRIKKYCNIGVGGSAGSFEEIVCDNEMIRD